MVPMTPSPVLSRLWYSASFALALSDSSASDSLAREPPCTAANGSFASPRTGCPDLASLRLYAFAAANASSACGYGQPSTVCAESSDVFDSSRAARYCNAAGKPPMHIAMTMSMAAMTRMAITTR